MNKLKSKGNTPRRSKTEKTSDVIPPKEISKQPADRLGPAENLQHLPACLHAPLQLHDSPGNSRRITNPLLPTLKCRQFPSSLASLPLLILHCQLPVLDFVPFDQLHPHFHRSVLCPSHPPQMCHPSIPSHPRDSPLFCHQDISVQLPGRYIAACPFADVGI